MGTTTSKLSRRGFLTGLGKAALCGAGALLLKPGSVDAHGSSWWHGLSQISRNQAIVDATAPWIGQWGGQCKEMKSCMYDIHFGDNTKNIFSKYRGSNFDYFKRNRNHLHLYSRGRLAA